MRIAGVERRQGRRRSRRSAGEGEPAPRASRCELNDKARPIHKDATLKIRPRIFLEGNFFVDLQPGLAVGARARRRRDDPDQPDRRARCSSTRSSPRCSPTRARTCSTLLERAEQGLRRRRRRGDQPHDRRTGSPPTRTRRSSTRRRSACFEHDLSGYIDGAGHGRRGRSTATSASCRALITDLRIDRRRVRRRATTSCSARSASCRDAARRPARARRAQRRAARRCGASPRDLRPGVRSAGPGARRAGPVRPPAARPRPAGASCAAWPPTCARPCPSLAAAQQGDDPAARAGPRRRRAARTRSSCRGRSTRSRTTTSRRSARSTRSRPSRSSASRARAARSTPTASGSASR